MSLSRRNFIQVTSLAGGGLALAFHIPGFAQHPDASLQAAMPNAFIRIHPDNRITFISPNIEMGQGIHTSHIMVLAEELDARVDQFTAEHSPVEARYNNPFFQQMATGGSTSTPAFWEPLRQAGAQARALLLAAGAERLGVPIDELRSSEGTIRHEASGRSLSYGELTGDAVRQKPPETLQLKAPADFKIIGQSTKRVEGHAKVTGQPIFGIDLDLPGKRVATIARPPVMGSAPGAIRNEATVAEMPGVHRIKPVRSGVAVIADNYWLASKARKALDIEWQASDLASLSSDSLFEQYEELVATEGLIGEDTGDIGSQLNGEETVRATFRLPFLAHAAMEPLNATAKVSETGAEVWAGTYLQTNDRRNVADFLGLAPDQVQIHTQLAGGAFGRRATATSDFIMEAVECAQGEDHPVQLIWSREDDTRGGYYRPLNVNRLEASLGPDGRPTAWRHRVATPSILASTPFAVMVNDGIDPTSLEGARNLPYAIPNRRVELHSPESGIPVLWWRSVGHTYTGFVTEHFLDLLARKAAIDPVEYRRQLLADNEDPRFLGVLELAAREAGWGEELPPGRARGVALHKSFSTYVCQIAECSMTEEGTPRVHRVTAAVDLGIAVNPWNVEQQIQGAINYALSAVLYGAIDIDRGQVQQGNFDDYRVLRMPEAPEIDVHIVPSEAPPTGAGEPGVPPLAAAVANAVLALTGEPTTRLPYIGRAKNPESA